MRTIISGHMLSGLQNKGLEKLFLFFKVKGKDCIKSKGFVGATLLERSNTDIIRREHCNIFGKH